jgi:nicotinamidase-related amidase
MRAQDVEEAVYICREARLLVCLDLQLDQIATDEGGHAGRDTVDGARARLDTCARVLAHARSNGWSVVHAHRRPAGAARPDSASPIAGGARHRASPPIPGFEPHPSEPIFYREGLSALSNRRLVDTLRASREAQVMLIGFDLAGSGLATALAAYDLGAELLLAPGALLSARPARSDGTLEAALWEALSRFARMTTVEAVLNQPCPGGSARVANER